MDILKVIALLLDYPSQAAAQHAEEFASAIRGAEEISPAHRNALLETLDDIYGGELLDAEECYTGLFEQGRSLSLHLFEHVHGESRDRGQAMVDLMAEYSNHGFELDARELPDYIPLFLEYLANRPHLEAREWLADVSHILALLGARLVQRQSAYANLFKSLLLIAGRSDELDEKLAAQVALEEADNTAEALDKEWEEVAVTFAADDPACASTGATSNAADQPRALRWADHPGSNSSIANPQHIQGA